MSDFLGPAKVTVAGLDAAVTAKITTPGSATATALNATFVPKWKATTAYLAGDKVLSPAGDVVSAKVNFTSGASFSAANWDYSATYALADPAITMVYGDSANPTLPTSVTENGITTTFTYDSAGNPLTRVRQGVTRTFTYTGGNLTGVA